MTVVRSSRARNASFFDLADFQLQFDASRAMALAALSAIEEAQRMGETATVA